MSNDGRRRGDGTEAEATNPIQPADRPQLGPAGRPVRAAASGPGLMHPPSAGIRSGGSEPGHRQPPPSGPTSRPGLPMPDSWDARFTASRMAAPMPPAPAHGGRRKRSTVMILGVVAVMATTAAAAIIAWSLTSPDNEDKSPARPVPNTAATSATTTRAPAKTPTPPAPDSAASTKTAAKPAPTHAGAPKSAPPIPKDKRACFATLLKDDAFGHTEPNLDRCCGGKRAYQTMLQLKSAIVRAGGSGITETMAEWSKLGWYEMPAFAVMRAHCCPDAPALTVPRMFALCRIEESLAYISNALDDEKKMTAALDDFDKAAQCMARRGWSDAFGRGGSPYGGERTYFERIMQRVRAARGR